jgi:hypothetical protein
VTRGGRLWLVAAAVTVAAAAWQERTGPTHPYRTTLALGGVRATVWLPRSHVTTSGAPIAVPVPQEAADASGTLFWRRYPTADPFTATPLRREGGSLAADLPPEPRAWIMAARRPRPPLAKAARSESLSSLIRSSKPARISWRIER